MNITVARRIIGGFTAMVVLLIMLGIFSYSNLSQVGNATEEVNELAIPTLSGSNGLKASFLNMGRLTFEAYIEDTLSGLATKQDGFNASKATFDSEYKKLASTVSEEKDLSATLSRVKSLYDEYTTNVDSMYQSHKASMDIRNAIADTISDAEDNADDAATYVLDFADMDEVQGNRKLRRAAELGGNLESSLLTLLTTSSEYVKTETLVRAQTLGNEVELVVNQVQGHLDSMMEAADGEDDSGTLDEISDMVSAALDAVRGSDGILKLHVERLNYRTESQTSLTRSDENIKQAIVELEKLLALANGKAKDIEEQVNSKVSGGIAQVFVVGVISIAIALGIGWWIVNSITKPLNRVNELLNIASSGDLTHRLDDSASDEFGELARNCNKLIANLKSLIAGINDRAEQLAAASEQTSAVTAQTTSSIQEQKSQIAQVATATTEMHSTSQLVSQNAEDTLGQIRHADAEAEKVRKISVENKETIEVLAKDVEEAANVINKLHQDSASIGGILDVIRGVADQTNLLALNAAIEAARAGEQGRGFAVVADEVRTLASRTQESTQEINSMIEVLQAGAEKAVAVMNQGKEQTGVCVQQTENATKALDLISDAVHKAFDVSTQIEQSAREQNVVSQEISEKLEGIVNIAEETTIGAQQTSDSSHEVARLAEELQQSIRQFKV